jgi:hypothetical protein
LKVTLQHLDSVPDSTRSCSYSLVSKAQNTSVPNTKSRVSVAW